MARLMIFILALMISGCSLAEDDAEENVLYVYNWGDYLDMETVKKFEEETGITVIYDEYDTNESMYPRIAEGAIHYDVICPSDYMIQKMIANDLLQPLDFEKLPTAKKYIGADFFEQSKSFDPENKYSVPYCWGTVGIIYDTKQLANSLGRKIRERNFNARFFPRCFNDTAEINGAQFKRN